MKEQKISLAFTTKVQMAGNKICAFYTKAKAESEHCQDTGYNVGYKQGLRDALEIMKREHVLKDYSFVEGVTLEE